MNNWINWLFNSGKQMRPPVEFEGEVRIEGNKAIYKARKGYRETAIDLTRLQYIYLYITEDRQNLVLNDEYQHFIPCYVDGFDMFFRHLSRQFSLDEKTFLELLAANKPQNTQLWRAESPNNCKVLASDSGQLTQMRMALPKGFEVGETAGQWVSWDMTSEALAKLPFVYQINNAYSLAEIRFQFPVQLGNLILEDWRYALPAHHRLDVPLDSFYTNLRIKGNGDQNYFLAKNALCEVMGESTETYERDDQNACHWLFNGLKFSLIYWYDSRSSYESGYAYLGVTNEREYPDYLIDKAYELNGQISKSLRIDHPFQIGSDFRRSRYFRQTPGFVTDSLTSQEGKLIIWLDQPNGKIGFANQKKAMIFPLEMLIGFELQNVLPGRSSGGSYLSVILTDQNRQSILIGDVNAFDSFVDRMTDLFHMPVTELTPYEE